MHSRDVRDREAVLKDIFALYRSFLVDLLTLAEGNPVLINLVDSDFYEPIFSEYSTSGQGTFFQHNGTPTQSFNQDLVATRGAQLAIMYPEIYEAQIDAILCALRAVSDKGITANLEVNYPHLYSEEELDKRLVLMDRVAKELCLNQQNAEACISIDTPRSVFVSKTLSKYARNICFNLDNLTEHMLGLARYTSQNVLQTYSE